MSEPAHRRGGFSVVEMLLILTMMGIMVAIAAPSIDYAGSRVEAQGQEITSRLAAAQQQAVLAQHDVVVAFDTAGRRIRWHQDLDDDGAMDEGEPVTYTDLDTGVVFALGTAAARPRGDATVSFAAPDGGLPQLTFHRNGSASEAGGLYVTTTRALTDTARADDARSIEIERATGRVSRFSYTSGSWRREF